MAARSKAAVMVALLCLLSAGCRSEGTRTFTVTFLGQTLKIVDETSPNSKGEDRYEMGLTVGGLAILQSLIDERRAQDAED